MGRGAGGERRRARRARPAAGPRSNRAGLFYPSIYLTNYLSILLTIYLSNYLSIYLPTYLSIYVCIYGHHLLVGGGPLEHAERGGGHVGGAEPEQAQDAGVGLHS